MKIVADLSPVLCGGNRGQSDAATARAYYDSCLASPDMSIQVGHSIFHIGDNDCVMLRKIEIVCRMLEIGLMLYQKLILQFKLPRVGRELSYNVDPYRGKY